ncbi:RNA-directed DNA polymerase, eukaryota, Reverse transcriptase zinc-binding domain protein [Artemisia annua]|uniref:RNA-directed DNA polymerase, eukaryota, Reverse transcriptase zinc-binding domain protein n=1 Tax=Artemisia annua TaxID=35608 RepID=A0A2U1MEI6_ARTAN|nr:RNA-directed DNA polymerase, eukaryota, Reverse transcriptase zinc-binding domain protein [Artemisia annua]
MEKANDVGKTFVYKPKAIASSSNSMPSRGETSTNSGQPPAKGGVSTSNVSSKSNESSQPTRDVTKSSRHPTPKVNSPNLGANVSTSNPFQPLSCDDGVEGILNLEDEEEVEITFDESRNLLGKSEASTSVFTVPDFTVDGNGRQNGNLCSKGSRILGWNDDIVDIIIIWIVEHFGANAGFIRSRPWVLLGNFNVALSLEDHLCGGYVPTISMREFKECVQTMEASDVNSMGLHFTWNQKPKGSNDTLKKIDRIMENLQFFILSRVLLPFPNLTEGFRDLVASGWNLSVDGYEGN